MWHLGFDAQTQAKRLPFNLKVYFRKIPSAKCMLVIVTRALFESEACLHEIGDAFKHGLEVIPLLFEADALHVVPPHERWSSVFEKYGEWSGGRDTRATTKHPRQP